MSGPSTEWMGRGLTEPVVYQVESPCCRRPCIVERWALAHAQAHRGGKLTLRCGSILDTPGWRKPGEQRQGCGETFVVNVDDLRMVSR